MENKNEIGKVIKSRLQLLDKSPDAKLWQKIATDLDHKKLKKRIMVILLPFLLTTLFSYIGYNYFFPNNIIESKNILINNNIISSKKNSIDQNQSIQKLNSSQNIKINKIEETEQNQKRVVAKDSEKVNNSRMSKTDLAQDSFSKRRPKPIERPKKSFDKTMKLVRSNVLFDEYEVTIKQKYFFKKFKNNSNRSKKFVVILKNQKYIKVKYNKKLTKISNSSQQQKHNNVLNEIIENTNSADIIKENSKIKPQVDSILSKENFETNKTIVRKLDKKTRKSADSVQIKLVELPKIWLVGSIYCGPSFYNSFGSENYVIGNQKTEKNGVITYNYGFYLRWMAHKNIGLRMGLGKTAYHYEVSTANNNNFIETNNIMLQNYLPSQIYSLFQNSSAVVFTQKTSYYELPLEAYVILKDYKDFEIATNFGFSILFLEKNRTMIKSENISELQIGSNNNVQKFAYTTNFGLNFSYKITKRINFDVSPSVKYQFLELIRNSNFQPYSLNLQTGFSYKW